MVTLDERVEAMMTLANKSWKTESPSRKSRGSSPASRSRDDYHSDREYADSSRQGDADSLLRTPEKRIDREYDDDDEGNPDDNCLLKCGRCLARIPCSAVCCWVFMCTAVSMACGGVLVTAYKGQDMFDRQNQPLYDICRRVSVVLYACIGVLLIMVFLGSWFVVVSVLSSGRTSRRVFNSRKKNVCARVLNGITITLMLFLQLVWILASVLLALPVAVMTLLTYMHYVQHEDCVDLKYYGLSNKEYKLCGVEFDRMMYKSKPVFIGLIFGLVGAILTVKSMTFFILCASSNTRYLRESRFAAYTTQQNGKRSGSIASHQDTKM